MLDAVEGAERQTYNNNNTTNYRLRQLIKQLRRLGLEQRLILSLLLLSLMRIGVKSLSLR